MQPWLVPRSVASASNRLLCPPHSLTFVGVPAAPPIRCIRHLTYSHIAIFASGNLLALQHFLDDRRPRHRLHRQAKTSQCCVAHIIHTFYGRLSLSAYPYRLMPRAPQPTAPSPACQLRSIFNPGIRQRHDGHAHRRPCDVGTKDFMYYAEMMLGSSHSHAELYLRARRPSSCVRLGMPR